MKFTRPMGAMLVASLVALTGVSSAFAQQSKPDDQLYQEAKKEGHLTWYSGILNQALCDKIGQAFAKRYPGIQVNAIKTTSQVAFQRLMQDIKAGSVQSDVFTTTDMSHMAYLEKHHELIKYTPPNETKLVKSLQNVDPNGYYHVTWVGLAAIAYNTKKVPKADAPKNWTDLTNPKWKNEVAFGSPNYSGMVGVWSVAMQKLYGWDYFTKLNKLNPLIGRSIDDAVTMLNSGEREVALANPGTVLRSVAKGNPLAVVYPTDGTVAVISPSAIIKGAKDPAAAKLFMNFLESREFAKILVSDYEQPLRTDVPPPAGAKPLDQIKLITPTLEEIQKNLPDNKTKWRDTFGM